MTLLRGQFAMMLVCSGTASRAEIAAALAPLTADGTLSVAVREMPTQRSGTNGGSPWVLTVHGGDRTGIVSAVVAEVAGVGGNITDLTTRLAGDLYLLIAEIDLPDGVEAGALQSDIATVAADLGVGATLRPVEADEL